MINTNELLKKYNFPIRKQYGQNFLTDINVLEGIVNAAHVTKDDVVIEIGPGLGALTGLLCKRAKAVAAVEIDKMLIPILNETMAGYENFLLINEDILKVDISGLINEACKITDKNSEECLDNCAETAEACLEEKSDECAGEIREKCLKDSFEEKSDKNNDKKYQKVKIVANLPYYITTPIIMQLLEKQENIDSITVMIQKEVAQRMKEGPGSKAYGALSLAVQYYSKPHIDLIVSKNCFIPKPEVDSAVITLDIYKPEERPVKAKDSTLMFDIIRAAFNQRRKTLVNALSNAQNLNFTKEEITRALIELGKSETVRGEALTLEEFAKFSDEIVS